MAQDTVSRTALLEGRERREIQAAWRSFVRPLLRRCSQRLDLRLVRTLRDGAEAAIRLRPRPQGLWLTELGSLLLGAVHAPAGVKRLTRLFAADWSAEEIEHWLLEQADTFMAAQPAGEGLVTFDQSVVEKPESACAEGLCVHAGCARAKRAGWGGTGSASAAAHQRALWSCLAGTGWRHGHGLE